VTSIWIGGGENALAIGVGYSGLIGYWIILGEFVDF